MDIFEAIRQRRSIRSYTAGKVTDEEIIKQSLHLPRGIRPVAIIPVGHTKSKAKPTPRKPLGEVTYYERF